MSFYIKIVNGLLEPKHVEAMGEAVWLYMWLQDKNTSVNENGMGKVLGNEPIKYEKHIKNSLGISRATYVRWVDRLREAGYVNTLRTPGGLIITITKAKKFDNNGKKRSVKIEHHKPSDVAKVTHRDVAKVQQLKTNSDVAYMNSDVAESNIDVANSNIQYKTRQILDKDNTSITNVIGETPQVFGKTEINNLFEYWKQKTGVGIASNVQRNRNACNNLYRKYGDEKLRQLVDGVALAQSTAYAPRISDFCELQSKLTQLLTWGKSRETTQKRTIKI